MTLRVMKFGGASVKAPDAVRNVADIIGRHQDAPCVVVISAMDKTTNELEKLAFLAKDGDEIGALGQLKKISDFHRSMALELFGEGQLHLVEPEVTRFLGEVERIVRGILLLGEFTHHTYDRIVAYGELISTVIVARYLSAQGQPTTWLDARKLIVTDANHKQAGVIWSRTESRVREAISSLLTPGHTVIVQGFIGSTPDGHTTTLGREGSDFTASILAHCLGASSVTVWKDVAGVLNGDPRKRESTVKHDQLSYHEAVEMTFYGATVIHPKTIKPLYNKQIPLLVKCFKDLNETGTVIAADAPDALVPTYITKDKQVYIRIQARDFSFMEERQMQEVLAVAYKSGLRINLVQNTAISLLLCADDKAEDIQAFSAMLLDAFEVVTESGLTLHTVLHFTPDDLAEIPGAVMAQLHDKQLCVVKR